MPELDLTDSRARDPLDGGVLGRATRRGARDPAVVMPASARLAMLLVRLVIRATLPAPERRATPLGRALNPCG
jgi:hypothetical protein